MSYALHGGGLLDEALTSVGLLAAAARPARAQWITTYGSGGHSYMVVAGLRFDTGYNDSDSDGPRLVDEDAPGERLHRPPPGGPLAAARAGRPGRAAGRCSG